VDREGAMAAPVPLYMPAEGPVGVAGVAGVAHRASARDRP
jgi:hypothetical protein